MQRRQLALQELATHVAAAAAWAATVQFADRTQMLPVGPAVVTRAHELKDAWATPGGGGWVGATVTLHATGSVDVDFCYDGPLRLLAPMPQDLAAELSCYPRDPAAIPTGCPRPVQRTWTDRLRGL